MHCFCKNKNNFKLSLVQKDLISLNLKNQEDKLDFACGKRKVRKNKMDRGIGMGGINMSMGLMDDGVDMDEFDEVDM